MIRKSKRELAREIDRMTETQSDDVTFTIACEHDDGTYTDLEGNPLPDGAEENAIVVSWRVAQTWPCDGRD